MSRIIAASAVLLAIVWAAPCALAQMGGPFNPAGMASMGPLGAAMNAVNNQQPPKHNIEDTMREVNKKIEDVDPRVRVAALELMRDVNKPEAHGVMIRSLSDADLRVKIKAIDLLGDHQVHDAVPMMSQLLFLRETADIVKLHLVAALGRIGDAEGALPILQYLKENHDQRSRGAAVFALGEIGNTDARNLLTTIAGDDSSPTVRRLAEEALAKIDGELPSIHSQQLAAKMREKRLPTFERLSKLREIDEKLQEQNW